jgi:lysophospholipase L1-like esterase
VLVVGLVCFLLWAIVAAPGLKREAEASPLGLRRTVALAVLEPLARISAFFGLDRFGHEADRLLGRGPKAVALPPVGFVPGDPRSGGSAGTGTAGPTIPPGTPGDPGIKPNVRPPSPKPSAQPLLDRPTKKNPLSVLAVGDSLGGDLAIGLGRLLGGKDAYRLHTDAREATGLARPDYFDWPYQVALDLRDAHPDLVVAMFGANDAQGFIVGDRGYPFGTEDWRRIYRQRVAQVMAEATAGGRPMIWVGQPIMGRDSLSQGMIVVNAIARAEARRRKLVFYLDTWALFSDSAGHYSPYLSDGSGGTDLVRERDGVHLTVDGDLRLGNSVLELMVTLWKAPK